MKRFKNILFILDDASVSYESSLDTVATLARLNEARVRVLSIEQHGLLQDLELRFDEQARRFQHMLEEQHRADLQRFLENGQWDGISVSASVLHGAGFIDIIKRVIAHGHDLVVMEESLHSGVGQLTMRLVRKCPCPVWVIKRGSSGFKRILAALDVDEENPEAALLNKKIVALAHSLAQREQGKSYYAHAWRLESELMLRGPRFNVSLAEILEMKSRVREERQRALDDILLANNIAGLDDHVLVREGGTTEVIQRIIDEYRIDVLVMGSVGRSGIPGLLIGNRAEKILTTINCSVLTVKPEGFISPVRVDDGELDTEDT